MQTRITLRQLEYCIAAGEFGSIAEAAEQIHISPSSISAAIAHVETELAVSLFVRHHAQGLSVTPVGREVLKQVRHLLDQSLALYDIANNAQSNVRGPLRVGCFTTLAALIAPELCQGFGRAYPSVQVTQIEDHQEGLIERLRCSQIDIAIAYDLNISESDIAFEPLASLPPYVIVSEQHPLAHQKAVTLAELAAFPMVLLDLPHSRDYFVSVFQQAGLSPNIAARTSSPEVLRTLVANDIGYSIVNIRPRTAHALDGKRIINIRLSGSHRPMLLGLARLKAQKPRQVVEVFMQRSRNFISNEYIPGMNSPSLDARLKTQRPPSNGKEINHQQ
ncbi:LysR family transcriptional regulator [Paracandidimonas soli]|uniref:DNA-binding transcriptional LysR family regulator n=1 Tax=Paracandidimonas soli TaxID=1917182 RepID=A0A4R3VGB4_9BURK|nr:LysR family transcriptional regulator [Paracandidimonas soli]TCV02842.1 DNA-binding transcriptional LysR family regulator [Paracandidimonas soli]